MTILAYALLSPMLTGVLSFTIIAASLPLPILFIGWILTEIVRAAFSAMGNLRDVADDARSGWHGFHGIHVDLKIYVGVGSVLTGPVHVSVRYGSSLSSSSVWVSIAFSSVHRKGVATRGRNQTRTTLCYLENRLRRILSLRLA